MQKRETKIYLKQERNAFLGSINAIFDKAGELEQKIIKSAIALEKSTNKINDYITLSKMIDKQIQFLTDLQQQEKEKKPIIDFIKKITRKETLKNEIKNNC